MFFKKTSEQPAESPADTDAPRSRRSRRAPGETPGKGRPTPTRRQAQAARQRPLVPADRKEAKRRSRQEQREHQYKVRRAMEAGEEWALPRKDRGRQRKFVRDYIDSRWTFAEFLLPLMVLGLPVTLIPNRTAMLVGYTLVYGSIVVAVFDITFLWWRIKKAIRERFDEEPQRGSLWYVITRTLQIRPGRLPKPQVKRGENVS